MTQDGNGKGGFDRKAAFERAARLDAVVEKATDDQAAQLMFDEADGLFDKRTDVQDAHDKYSERETDDETEPPRPPR